MGTRSTIAIENADGTVTGIYCHWDGYLSHNGRILQESYTDEAKVRELIALGDISSLREEIGQRHPFDTYHLKEEEKDPRWENWTTAYMRDRGEKDCAARTLHNWRQYRAENGQEYDYLFAPGKGWSVSTYNGIYDLAAALATETEES
jgi:hypothetical protein